MRNLAGLFVSVFILLSGIPVFAADGKDGAAVVTLYNDPQQTKYYVNDIYSTDRNRGVHCGVDTNMDNVKISSVFGDITLAGTYSIILNNETLNRLSFELLGGKNEGVLLLRSAFILKNKKNNKRLNKKTNNNYLAFNGNKVELVEFKGNSVQSNSHTYNRKDVIITTMDGTPVSIDGNFDYKITLQKENYKFTANISYESLRCHFGLAGQK